MKKVENPESQVDAITGATLTSNGVSDMLRDGFSLYATLFEEIQKCERIIEDAHKHNDEGEYNE